MIPINKKEMQKMQDELNKNNESILSPFVVSTGDDELELCPISVEHKERDGKRFPY